MITSGNRVKRYDAAVFDLDGTLLDTLADLTDSLNVVFAGYGLPPRTEDEVRSFVGNGIPKLIERAVPGGKEHEKYAQILSDFKEYYGLHCMDRTEPYPGIPALLQMLRSEGYRTAIVSNKADFAVKKLNSIYFRDLIPTAIGEREGVRKKPAPDTVLQALNELGVPAERAVYIGDSDVDIETARSCSMDCISVTWGFRSRPFLLEHGADPDRIADSVSRLKDLICAADL